MQPNDANYRGYFQSFNWELFYCCMQTIKENLNFYSSFFDITQVAPPQPFFYCQKLAKKRK
jgi:hypothetical protein